MRAGGGAPLGSVPCQTRPCQTSTWKAFARLPGRKRSAYCSGAAQLGCRKRGLASSTSCEHTCARGSGERGKTRRQGKESQRTLYKEIPFSFAAIIAAGAPDAVTPKETPATPAAKPLSGEGSPICAAIVSRHARGTNDANCKPTCNLSTPCAQPVPAMDQMGRLEDVLALRDAVYARLSAYLRLRNQLEPLKVANQPSLKTQVDIGSSVFMQARVYARAIVRSTSSNGANPTRQGGRLKGLYRRGLSDIRPDDASRRAKVHRLYRSAPYRVRTGRRCMFAI